MTNFSAGVAPAVLEVYDFSGIDVLVDVAGGHGMLLASILRKYPRMRGILFDLDHVLAGATAPDALGVSDRCTKVAGDFFKAVPPGGDAYLMKHIIHDWNDEQAGVILRNVRAALQGKPHGKVILIEAVIKPGNEPDLSKLIDLEMLLLPGGRERTEEEFAALFARNGFQLTRVVPTQSPLAVVEGTIPLKSIRAWLGVETPENPKPRRSARRWTRSIIWSPNGRATWRPLPTCSGAWRMRTSMCRPRKPPPWKRWCGSRASCRRSRRWSWSTWRKPATCFLVERRISWWRGSSRRWRPTSRNSRCCAACSRSR